MLEFNIRNQEISRIDNFSPAEKSVEYLIAKFNFKTEDWNGATKRAIFRNVKSKVEKDTMLENDSCIVPWEVLVGSSVIEVSVHGVIDTENITTDVAVFNLDRTLSGGSASQEPSPTVYEQILQEVKETKDIAQSVREDADNGAFDGEKGDKGDAGSIKFVIVDKLPTENIDTSAIYLLHFTEVKKDEDGNLAFNNNFHEYIYVNGAWECIGSASVEVDLSEYVKNTDYMSKDNYGVAKMADNSLFSTNGKIGVNRASENDIKTKANPYSLIPSTMIDLLVKVGMTTNSLEWTEEEKASARDLLGVTDLVGSVESILTELHTYAQTKIGGEA